MKHKYPLLNILCLIGLSMMPLLAQTGEQPALFSGIPDKIRKEIFLKHEDVNSGIGVRFQPNSDESVSVVQTFTLPKANNLSGIGVRLFPNENNQRGPGILNYELRIYEVGAADAIPEHISPPIRVVPFWMKGDLRESNDFLFVSLPEPLSLEAGKTYAFEFALMSKNSTRLTLAISKKEIPPPISGPSAFMIKQAENLPLDTLPVTPSGYNLAFFLTTQS